MLAFGTMFECRHRRIEARSFSKKWIQKLQEIQDNSVNFFIPNDYPAVLPNEC